MKNEDNYITDIMSLEAFGQVIGIDLDDLERIKVQYSDEFPSYSSMGYAGSNEYDLKDLVVFYSKHKLGKTQEDNETISAKMLNLLKLAIDNLSQSINGLERTRDRFSQNEPSKIE